MKISIRHLIWKKLTGAKSGFESIQLRYCNLKRKYALPIIFFLRIMIPEDFPNKTVYDSMHFHRYFTFTIHDIPKSLRVQKFWHEMAYFEQIMLCANIYITIKKILFANSQQIKLFQTNQFCLDFLKYRVSMVFRHFLCDWFSRKSILKRKYALPIIFFLRIMIPEDFPNKTVYDSMHFHRYFTFTIHDIPKSLRVQKFWHEMAYIEQIMLCANIYITIKKILFANSQQIKLFQTNQFCLDFLKYRVSMVFRHFLCDWFSRKSILKVPVA